MLEKMTDAIFAEHLGSKFRVHYGGATPLEVELVEVTPLNAGKNQGAKPRRAPFSIVFLGPAEPMLPQKMYSMEHDHLGKFDLFIVPIRRDKNGLQYEAIFN